MLLDKVIQNSPKVYLVVYFLLEHVIIEYNQLIRRYTT